MAGENEDIKKKIDESWKDAVKQEGNIPQGTGEEPPLDKLGTGPELVEEPPVPTFGLFISGLMMEGLIALGEVENPVTKKKELNTKHAKFIIDTLGMLKEKTKNNLNNEESNMLESILYELRMRFVGKTKA